MVGQYVPRALGITHKEVDGFRPANPQIRLIPMAHVPTLMLVEVATGAVMMGVGVEDMGMDEDTGMMQDIIGMIDPVASRCLAEYQCRNAMGKSASSVVAPNGVPFCPYRCPAEEIGTMIGRTLRPKAFPGSLALAALHFRGV